MLAHASHDSLGVAMLYNLAPGTHACVYGCLPFDSANWQQPGVMLGLEAARSVPQCLFEICWGPPVGLIMARSQTGTSSHGGDGQVTSRGALFCLLLLPLLCVYLCKCDLAGFCDLSVCAQSPGM